MTDNLRGLIERLEKLETGSRELDWLIAEALGDIPEHRIMEGVVELHIVFQDEGGAANLRFVEVETLDRKSVCAGTWLKRDDGYDVLALSVHPSDIKTVEAK